MWWDMFLVGCVPTAIGVALTVESCTLSCITLPMGKVTLLNTHPKYRRWYFPNIRLHHRQCSRIPAHPRVYTTGYISHRRRFDGCATDSNEGTILAAATVCVLSLDMLAMAYPHTHTRITYNFFGTAEISRTMIWRSCLSRRQWCMKLCACILQLYSHPASVSSQRRRAYTRSWWPEFTSNGLLDAFVELHGS